MFFILAIVSVFFAALAAGLLWSVSRLRSREELPDAVWLESFSPSRYRPMVRMLSEQDFAFASANGLSPADVQQLRADRRKIYRIYLSNLVRDFGRLHCAARQVLLTSEVDRPDLAASLIRVRAEFQRAVLAVQVRLMLNQIGLCGVDGSELVRAMENVYGSFAMLSSAASATAST